MRGNWPKTALHISQGDRAPLLSEVKQCQPFELCCGCHVDSYLDLHQLSVLLSYCCLILHFYYQFLGVLVYLYLTSLHSQSAHRHLYGQLTTATSFSGLGGSYFLLSPQQFPPLSLSPQPPVASAVPNLLPDCVVYLSTPGCTTAFST